MRRQRFYSFFFFFFNTMEYDLWQLICVSSQGEKNSFILIEKDLSSQKVCLHQLPQKVLITLYCFTINAYHIIRCMKMPDFIPWLSLKNHKCLDSNVHNDLRIQFWVTDKSQEEVWLTLVNLVTETYSNWRM